MEKDIQVKTIEWPTVIEYFTKLGRPLTKDEVKRLQDEDKRMKEEIEETKRREEEAERRRMARLMDELNGDQDQDQMPAKRAKFDVSSNDGDDSRDEDRVFKDFDEDDFDSDGDDDLERDMGTLGGRMGGRAQSHKNIGNLSEKRITADDYVHQLKVKSGRKGRYGVTVPKPFAFDARDSQKNHASIRERKVNEMVMEKKMEETNMIKHQFRHKPIPAAVLIPRYQAI